MRLITDLCCISEVFVGFEIVLSMAECRGIGNLSGY